MHHCQILKVHRKRTSFIPQTRILHRINFFTKELKWDIKTWVHSILMHVMLQNYKNLIKISPLGKFKNFAKCYYFCIKRVEIAKIIGNCGWKKYVFN